MGWQGNGTNFRSDFKTVIFYLTFNDLPSGIYSSQVIDVVKFLNVELKSETKLIAFISLRKFFTNRNKIKADLPDAIVIPMVPGVKRWRSNSVLLNILVKTFSPKAIIGRSVLATHLAFATGVKKIVYDGRGAIAAEWREYNVVDDSAMRSEIDALEKRAVLNSHFRIAVSEKLVNYWQFNYNYHADKHVVIPCTLNSFYESIAMDTLTIKRKREELGFAETDVICVYSGSLAGWQSFDLLYDFIKKAIDGIKNVKFLFLSDRDIIIEKLAKEFPNKIVCSKLNVDEVPRYLIAADYGLLIREKSVTNQVASPVKFAEYLACGLKVIISENLGDYSEFAEAHDCGFVYKSAVLLETIAFEEKLKIRQIGLKFTKAQYLHSYATLIN